MSNKRSTSKAQWQRAPDSRFQPRIDSMTILKRRGRQAEAHWDTTALCVARLKDEIASRATGSVNKGNVGAMMGDLIAEPERLGQVCLALLSMVVRLSDANMALQGQPGGFMSLVDYLTDTADKESGGYN